MPDTVCDVLIRLDEEVFVKPEDWQKDSAGKDDGPKCLVGGMVFAVFGTVGDCGVPSQYYGTQYSLYQDLRRAITKVIDTAIITGWNDAKERTFDDVKSAIRKAREEACK